MLRPRRRPLAVVLLALTLFFVPSGFADEAPEVRALWVDSFNPGLRSAEQIDELVARAKSGNLNTIIAQVRRNAQSLYAISFEGWVENYTPPEGFDPLQYLIEAAHAEGIEVHAWANIGPIFSGNPTVPTSSFPCKVPCNPNHIFNQHGYGSPTDENWLTRAHPSYPGGTTFSGQRTPFPQSLWFIDLGHPGAAEHTIDVLTHLLRNYDVDGIHLDYIRFPEMPLLSPRPPGVPVLTFSTGYNPTSVNRFNAAFGRPEGSLPNPWDPSFIQWRRDQVTAFVRRLYLEMGFINPNAKLSTASIAIYRGPNAAEPRAWQQTEAYYRVFQDWSGWMKEGILDMSIPMIYKTQHSAENRLQFRQWIEFTKSTQYDRHGVLGLAAYLNSLENTLVQISEGRAPSLTGATSRGFNFFSYNATNAAVTVAPATPLRPRDEFFRALTEDGAYAPVAPFPTPVSVPPMSWKLEPRQGHLLAQIIGADGNPADGAAVTIAKVGDGPMDQEAVGYADGNGYVGILDLNPGAYQLIVDVPDGEDRVTIPQPVAPGRVTRVTVNLSRPARGPIARAEHAIGANERTDHLEGASELEEWQGREPIPEDLLPPPPIEP